MKINSKNLFARYYNWIYGELPNDLCSFFWGSVVAILLKFIYIPGRIVNPNGSMRFWPGMAVLFGYCLSTYLGVSILASCYSVSQDGMAAFIMSLSLWILFLACPLVFIVFCSAILVGIGGIAYVGVLWDERRERVSETPKTTLISNAKDWVGAVRGKYCTKIDWTKK